VLNCSPCTLLGSKGKTVDRVNTCPPEDRQSNLYATRVTGNRLAHRLPCESGRVTTLRVSAVVTRPESDTKYQMSGNFFALYLRARWITA